MGMRFLAACVILAVLFIGPFAHAQSNVVLVTTDQILLDFFETSTVFDNVFDAIAFANEPRNRIDTIQIDEDADPSTSEIDAWAAGALPEITVSLKIEGLGHPKDVILQGSTSDPVLTVSGTAELIVESLTLTGGSNGVHAMENSTLIVNRCIIRDNDEYGVKINEPAPDPEDPPEILVRDQAIYNSAITDNSGGGVLVEAAEGLLTVLGCTLIDNGDAIALPEGADADITNTLIYRNTGVDISGTGTITTGYNYILDNAPPAFPLGTNDVDTTNPLFDDPLVDLGDPELLADSWKGKIVSFDSSPLLDSGNEIEDSPYTILDLDGEVRTAPTVPIILLPNDDDASFRDIGADELVASGVDAGWVFAEVIPDPVPALGAGQLSVRLRMPSPGLEFVPDTDTEIFAVTELGNKLLLDVIELTDGYFVGKNVEPILSNESPSHDGLAFIEVKIGDEPRFPVPDSQAETGRNFIIDTIAPVMTVTSGGLTANFFVTSGDATLAPAGIPLDPLDVQWRPAGTSQPYSDGRIYGLDELNPPVGGQAAQIFFNGPAPLTLTVTANFSDMAPSELDGLTPAGGGFDKELEISGPFQLRTDELTGDRLPPFNMPRWILDEGLLPIDAEVTATFTVGGAVEVKPDEFIYTNMRVVWEIAFSKLYLSANDFHYHLAIRFQGQDQAGNLTKDSELLDPLHIWYMDNAQTSLSPRYDREVTNPSFKWDLSRPLDPVRPEPCDPRFRYRLLKSVSVDGDPKLGPYQSVNLPAPTVSYLNYDGWSPYYSSAKGLPFEWFKQSGVITNLPHTWLILVVAGADEAGNVESDPLVTPFTVPEGVSAGLNWQRFMIPGLGQQIETTVDADFWWDIDMDGVPGPDEAFFPDGKIIPLPPVDLFNAKLYPNNLGARIEAKFRIEVIGTTAAREVDIELFEASNILESNTVLLPAGRDSVDVWLALDNEQVRHGLSALVGDPQRRVPRNYVLRATGYDVDPLGNRIIGDSTPANYAFTVAPTVEGFIENKQSADDQPIKVIESN